MLVHDTDYQLVLRSGFFHHDWYLSKNPDVKSAAIDPLLHFVVHGGFEGRCPGPDFDSAWYLAHYPDVAAAGLNPLVHYLNYGASEARLALPEPESGPGIEFGRTVGPANVEDRELVARIVTAYEAASRTTPTAPGLCWETVMFDAKRDVHEALVAGDHRRTAELLRDPDQTELFLGFDEQRRSCPSDDVDGEQCSRELYEKLRGFARAVGVERLQNPELDLAVRPPHVEELLTKLDAALGCRIDFPNPFPNEIGLATSRGVAGFRAIQALYQAWRIVTLVGSGRRVVEIGGGLGRTAYYAWRLGIEEYTLVDLPLTAVAQAYFLGRTLGTDAVCLLNEQRRGIRIVPPAAFLGASERYDLAVNVDSFPEMSSTTVLDYCAAIKQRCDGFLSINHESNPVVVRDVCTAVGLPIASRNPYWMRAGYVEELCLSRRSDDWNRPRYD